MLTVDFMNKNIIKQISNNDIYESIKNYYEKEFYLFYKSSFKVLIGESSEKAIFNIKHIDRYLNYSKLNEMYIKNIKDFIKPCDNYKFIKKQVCRDYIKNYVIKSEEYELKILYLYVYNLDEKLKTFEIKFYEYKDDISIKFYDIEHKIKDQNYLINDKIVYLEEKIRNVKADCDNRINNIEAKYNTLYYLFIIVNIICIIFIVNM